MLYFVSVIVNLSHCRMLSKNFAYEKKKETSVLLSQRISKSQNQDPRNMCFTMLKLKVPAKISNNKELAKLTHVPQSCLCYAITVVTLATKNVSVSSCL